MPFSSPKYKIKTQYERLLKKQRIKLVIPKKVTTILKLYDEMLR
jgi:hypothetical protein